MEKLESVYVVEANFRWSDVGNWLSLIEIGFENAKKLVKVDSQNIFAITEKPILVVGIDDVVVVENENGILVASMKDIERIREGVRKILKE
jgi:mannose-1-phosphate guanylyltransferase